MTSYRIGNPITRRLISVFRWLEAADTNEIVLGYVGPVVPPQTKPVPIVLQGHRAPVYGLSTAGDTQTLVTGSADGTIRVWKRPRSK